MEERCWMNKEKLQSLARDLRKTPPRSPRETLGGFVIAARMLEYFVEYIPKFCKPVSKVKFFFDVYDVEEGVL